MHELSIIEGLLQHVEKQRSLCPFARVTKIEVVCGKYNCLSEEHLQFWLSMAAKDTCAGSAQLVLRRIEKDYFCAQCLKEFSADGSAISCCPECGGKDLINAVDSSIYISKLEVD